MAVYAPDRRINPTIRRKGAAGRKSVMAGLYLTSMVDMFAILVIFLLQSFSAEGELIILPKGLELPNASMTGTLEKAPVLTVSREKIEFEGKFIANTEEVAAQEGWGIPALQDELKAFKTKLEEETREKLLAEGQEIPADQPIKIEQKINISADRRLQFQVVKKVIYNASFAGFPDFRFAVFERSRENMTTPSSIP